MKNLDRILRYLKLYYHFLWAFAGAVFYRFPSKKIKVIGVTGTSGKSTVVDLIARILEEAGYKVAVFSSIKFKIGEKERKNELRMTMPGKAIIQKFLREAVDKDCQFAVIEVTSEGILQYRNKFINFETAVFTNLSPEHIETHGSFENYKNTKGRFFKQVKKNHILNIDDKNTDYFLEFPAQKKYKYGLAKIITPDNEFSVTNCLVMQDGISFKVQDVEFRLNLLGGFNIYNSLAAICTGLSQGVSLEVCRVALKNTQGVPGRMEKVISEPFLVFVDYAITPNALSQVYETLTKNYRALDSKLICVLGACGGGRDKWKRPIFGELAGKYCQEVIITNEDPYDEEPMDIINQVALGAERISQSQPNQHRPAVYKILDRRQAINQALRLAKPDDIVVITGKGCEPSICLAGGKQISWDDRIVVKEEFEKIKAL